MYLANVFSEPLVKKHPLNLITLVVWTFLFAFFIAMIATIWVFAPSLCYCEENPDGTMSLSLYEPCIDEVMGTIAPAGLGTAAIFVVTIFVTLCGFDIIKHIKIFLIIYFVLSWPCGFIGWLLLDFEVYFAIVR